MTSPRSAVERALFPVLLTVLVAGLLLATPHSGAAPASSATASASKSRALYNETFEYGTRGWSASAKGLLTTVADGRRSRRAARLAPSSPGLVVASSTAHARDLRGARHMVSAWLRSVRGTVPARLVVREVEPTTGKVLDVRRDSLRVGPKWARTQVRVTRHSSSSVIRVEVRTRQSRRDRVLLDDVVVLRIKQGPKRKTPRKQTPPATPPSSPTPTPSATPTPTPTPAPTPPGDPGDVAGHLSNGCTYDSRGIPACGAYMGAAYGSNSDPVPMESATGQRLGVRRTYFQGNQVDKAVSVARSDLAAGRLPWISFKLPLTWEEMAAGKGDAWALDLANKLKALGGPVWVAFHHEPEKDGDILAWRAMQERLAPLVRAAAPNVAYTVITTGWNQLYGPTEFRLENIWPRNTKIDVAGFDVYNFHMTTRPDGSRLTKLDDIKAGYFDKFHAWSQVSGVPWALAETGQTDESFAVDPGWMATTHRQMMETGGIAMAYFNTELNSGGNSFPLVSAAKLAAFAAVQGYAPVLPKG